MDDKGYNTNIHIGAGIGVGASSFYLIWHKLVLEFLVLLDLYLLS